MTPEPLIALAHEPNGRSLWTAEPCCFCHQLTNFWTDMPDRTASEEVACCPNCAEIFEPEVVPTKAEWMDFHRTKDYR